MADVVPFTSRMSPAEYDRERARIAPTKKLAPSRWEQDMAALFYRSGWTQEELARREGKSQRWVSYYMLFGRFLQFSTAVLKAEFKPSNLNEGQFRRYWEQTTGTNERQRFDRVLSLMARETKLVSPPREPITQDQIIKRFGDGQWYRLEAMAEAFGTDPDHIDKTTNRMNGAKKEKRRVGRSAEYPPGFECRLFPYNSAVSLSEIKTKLRPIIKGLKAEGHKGMASMSTAEVLKLAHALQVILDEWVKAPEAGGASNTENADADDD